MAILSLEEGFAALGMGNPLRTLSEPDRKALWVVLAEHRWSERRGFSSKIERKISELNQACGDLETLAARLEVLTVTAVDHVEHLPEWRNIGELIVLMRNAAKARRRIEPFGKPGHVGKRFQDRYLAIAAELVTLKLGSPLFEHIAELYSQIQSDLPARSKPRGRTIDPRDSTGDDVQELSGDAIRKKVERLKASYFHYYEIAQVDAGMLASDPVKDLQEFWSRLIADGDESS